MARRVRYDALIYEYFFSGWMVPSPEEEELEEANESMLELLAFVLLEVDEAEDFGVPEDDALVPGVPELADETTEVLPDAEETVVLEGDGAPGVDDPEVPDADEVPGVEEEAEDFGGVGVGMATMLALDVGRSSGAQMLS